MPAAPQDRCHTPSHASDPHTPEDPEEESLPGGERRCHQVEADLKCPGEEGRPPQQQQFPEEGRCRSCEPCLRTTSCGACSSGLDRQTGHGIYELKTCVAPRERTPPPPPPPSPPSPSSSLQAESCTADPEDLVMDCEEEELDPWQRAIDSEYQTIIVTQVPGSPSEGSLDSMSPTEGPLDPFPPTEEPLFRSCSLPGLPIIVSTQSLAPGVSTDQTNPMGLILNGQPRTGEAGRFTAVQIPVTLTIRSPAGVQTIRTSGSVSLASSSSSSSIPPRTPTPTPIITEVVSLGAPESADSPMLQLAEPAAASSSPSCSPPISFPKGRRDLATCVRCDTGYQLVHALRGYMCICSVKIVQSLKKINSSESSEPKKHSSKGSKFSEDSSDSSEEDSTQPKKKTEKLSSREKKKKKKKKKKTTPLEEQSPRSQEGERERPRRGKGETDRLREEKVERKLSFPVTFWCLYCDKKTSSNIRFMAHVKRHIRTLNRKDEDYVALNSCERCFRRFPTLSSLQGHIQSIHGNVECTAKCKICDLAFESEPVFLQHTKDCHKPGEMPYSCQVCQFRSSFYSEVMDHFREAHSDTSHLICPYCLKVFRYGLNYQHHYIRHQMEVFSCDCCRLQFLLSTERAEHQEKDHIKPELLEDLTDGTEVTDSTGFPGSRVLVLEGLDVPSAPQATVSPKRTPPQSPAHLRTTFQTHGPEMESCVECSFSIPDFLSHYPTYVHCSLCRYRTSCSRAYANHMSCNHGTRKRTCKYMTMYESYPRERKMRCTSCRYSTTIGDMMANHLTDHPDHLVASFNTTVKLILVQDPHKGQFGLKWTGPVKPLHYSQCYN